MAEIDRLKSVSSHLDAVTLSGSVYLFSAGMELFWTLDIPHWQCYGQCMVDYDLSFSVCKADDKAKKTRLGFICFSKHLATVHLGCQATRP